MNHIRKEARTSKRFPWYITPIFFLIVFLLFFSIFVIPMGVGQAIAVLPALAVTEPPSVAV